MLNKILNKAIFKNNKVWWLNLQTAKKARTPCLSKGSTYIWSIISEDWKAESEGLQWKLPVGFWQNYTPE